jgi:hypothetical protein
MVAEAAVEIRREIEWEFEPEPKCDEEEVDHRSPWTESTQKRRYILVEAATQVLPAKPEMIDVSDFRAKFGPAQPNMSYLWHQPPVGVGNLDFYFP